jgi:4-hydroxybenzoate polyprenyltransferase
MLNPLCFYLSFPVLGALFFYSWTKRFTWLSHLYLGFAISLAPPGAWVAIANGISWEIFLLSAALMTYIAGFDILYACQDTDFDKKAGLFSIPVRFGVSHALLIAKILHGFSFCFFVLIFLAFDMTAVYLVTVFVIGTLFIIEHRLVKPHDLSHIDIAFFHVNSLISVLVFVGVLADELIAR